MGKTINVNLMNQGDNSFFEKYGLTEKTEKKKYFRQEKAMLEKYCEKVANGTIKEYPFLRGYFDSDFFSIHLRNDLKLAKTHSFTHICVPGAARLLVDYSGELHFCTNASSAMSIGNVDEGFNERRIAELIEKYRNILGGDCLKCWAIRFCSICYIHAMRGEEFCKRKKMRYCAALKRKLGKQMRMYLRTMHENDGGFDYLADYAMKND